MCAHALTEIGKSSASSGHTDRKLAFEGMARGLRERGRKRNGESEGEREREGETVGERDGLKFHNPAVSDTLD